MALNKIGLFYGSSTCYTEMTAEKIQRILGEDRVDVFNIADEPISTTEDYQHLIFGIPTWDFGELQEDWENIWDEIDAVDFSGKTIAIYGQGDQVGYAEWFQDAMGFLWAKLVNLGAKAIGQWPADGFEFGESKALTADKNHFVGLALDDENQFDLSQQRLESWCEQILREFEQENPSLRA
ncbi:flavodoxin FldB [Porticoccus sp. W117]|uniref:flavodoxin FldB n=1 Tax=Porticoccus sp. W117 TaxID=3054777 RepID=UPI0025917C5E|nr:flavodoxin FldB [Porticoccus sp. W117]MDM3872636.1 flavodoxin FldB [Porticoccus sp. W117]